MARPPIVRLDRVSKDYREGEDVRHVLRETSADFAEGELVAIRGRSGSGKSTLLNLIAGIDVPTAGDVWVAGTRLGGLDPEGRPQLRFFTSQQQTLIELVVISARYQSESGFGMVKKTSRT